MEWEARQKKSGGEGSRGGRSQDGGGRGRGRGRGGGRGDHGGRGEAGKDNAVKRDKSHVKCFKCKNYGHYANRCPGEKKKEEEAHHARAVQVEPSVLLAETTELGPSEHLTLRSLFTEVNLEELKLTPELHFTGEEEPTSNV